MCLPAARFPLVARRKSSDLLKRAAAGNTGGGRIRRKGLRGLYGGDRRGWNVRRGWPSGGGSHASSRGDGCSAGRCACSRSTPLGSSTRVCRLDQDGRLLFAELPHHRRPDRRPVSHSEVEHGMIGRTRMAMYATYLVETGIPSGPSIPTDLLRYARADFWVKLAEPGRVDTRGATARRPRVSRTPSRPCAGRPSRLWELPPLLHHCW